MTGGNDPDPPKCERRQWLAWKEEPGDQGVLRDALVVEETAQMYQVLRRPLGPVPILIAVEEEDFALDGVGAVELPEESYGVGTGPSSLLGLVRRGPLCTIHG